MKNKHILIISHLYPTKGRPTGGTFVHQQALALVKAEYSVRVISPQVAFKTAVEESGEIEGISVSYPRYLSFGKNFTAWTDITCLWGIRRNVKNLDFSPDLVLAHTALPDGGVARLISKKLNIPYFVYVHGADVQHKIDYNKATKKKITKILKEAKKVLVNSSKTQRLVGGLGINSVLVPMGVNELKAESYKVIKSGKPNNTPTVRLISVCNLGKEKGIQFAIEALKKIDNKNIEYLIIGSGSYESELRKMARADSRIKLLGRLSQEEVFKNLSQSDIFVMPSYNEAFGVAYLEAMNFGLPIIGTKDEGVEDIVRKGNCGILVEPQSVDSVKVALEELISNDDLREKMGSEGKRIVNENYLWSQVAGNLIKELEE